MPAEFVTQYSEWISTTLQPDPDPKWRALDLFAGCGGLALGFEAAGFSTIGFEMDRDAVATYNKNLAGECFEEFLTEDSQLPPADIVIGGPPCQPFSVGGSQKGLHDDRDGFPAFIAAVAHANPMLFVFENVRGMLYRNKGYYESVLRRLSRLGYVVEEAILNAVDYQVPQNRERVVVVGHRTNFEYPKPHTPRVTVREALGGYLEHFSPESRFLTPNQDAYIARYEEKSKCARPRDLHPERPARTLTCRNLGGATSDMHRIALPDGRRRRITVEEAARLQSFPDWFEFTGPESSQFDQVGNAVAPMFAYHLALAVRDSLESGVDASETEPKGREVLTLFDDISDIQGDSVQKIDDVLERVQAQKTFIAKDESTQKLVLDSLRILNEMGLPIHDLLPNPRSAERVALALMSLCGIEPKGKWRDVPDVSSWSRSTRGMIEWQNETYGEDRSPGSYDDVRRKDLLWMSLAGIAVNTGQGSKNVPTRKFGLSPEAAQVIRTFGTKTWSSTVKAYREAQTPLVELLENPRRMAALEVTFGAEGESVSLNFGPGEHNHLIKECIEEFLPRWGYGAEVLYVGDADDRHLFKNEERLLELGVFDLATDELPDIVAYSHEKDWIYIVEAVHSSGPVSREKHLRYKRLFEQCPSGVVYVTAFASRDKFRRFAADIAWETEVWIAAEPTHLIHYNGDRFLGPHPD
jgi:DNA (cytosine-5)-methyltransferase 1